MSGAHLSYGVAAFSGDPVHFAGKCSDKRALSWRRLMGENQLPKVIAGVRFQDGTEVNPMPSQSAA
jgi:hypothetical protein